MGLKDWDQDTETILAEIGISTDQVADLRAKGVV